MHPTTALMLARTIEDDRRRDAQLRRSLASHGPRPQDDPRETGGRLGWLPRLARLGFAGSKG